MVGFGYRFNDWDFFLVIVIWKRFGLFGFMGGVFGFDVKVILIVNRMNWFVEIFFLIIMEILLNLWRMRGLRIKKKIFLIIILSWIKLGGVIVGFLV